MGLFSKRKGELDADAGRTTPLPAEPAVAAPTFAPAEPAEAPAPAAAPRPTGAFGIEQAMALLKSMPPTVGSPKAYMAVVKKTLEAVGVSVEEIVADGERRSSEVVSEIGLLQQEVGALEQAAAAKKQRVTELQAELEEIGSVQERFRADTVAARPSASMPAAELRLKAKNRKESAETPKPAEESAEEASEEPSKDAEA